MKAIVVALLGMSFIIIIGILIERMRFECPYCKKKTVRCTGVDNPSVPHNVIYICDNCHREYM